MDNKAYERLRPHVGALVWDEARKCVGVLMAVGAFRSPQVPADAASPPPLAYIRPPAGGCEWTTELEAVSVLPPTEALLAKVRCKNEQSTGDQYGRRG
ncbi:hypothetical protein LHJ74_32920 [Streptomyces sp. N2-109]|uniref:Uncharacterized protein n=1 Tax=Streptomyces gossypii TaxID=2883101 RepID=A0ABT2K3A8_9ACTN|nr:hypothetical protein [Streptomyces gossypii]MCT2594660.1 hypothetical protein [Streptomyces gossypii]